MTCDNVVTPSHCGATAARRGSDRRTVRTTCPIYTPIRTGGPSSTLDASAGPAMDNFAQWDPDWTERCARMTNNPWTTGVLPVKWIELICIALNAACTYRNESGMRCHSSGHPLGSRHVADPVRGSREVERATGTSPTRERRNPRHRPGKGRGTVQPSLGGDLPARPAMARAVPGLGRRPLQWCPAAQTCGTHRYRGRRLLHPPLPPGIRRHVAAAVAHGATVEEIMEVLKLCGAQGVDACELGAPILAQELANHQKKTETS